MLIKVDLVCLLEIKGLSSMTIAYGMFMYLLCIFVYNMKKYYYNSFKF